WRESKRASGRDDARRDDTTKTPALGPVRAAARITSARTLGRRSPGVLPGRLRCSWRRLREGEGRRQRGISRADGGRRRWCGLGAHMSAAGRALGHALRSGSAPHGERGRVRPVAPGMQWRARSGHVPHHVRGELMRTYLCWLVMGVLTAAMSLGCAAEPSGSEKASARGEVDPRGYRDIGGDTEHWEGGEFTPQHAVVDASKPDHERDAGVKLPKDKDAGPPPKKPGRCWVTGGGQIDGETFGGNAKPFRDGSVDGEWNHVDHQGNHFHGDPTEIITCDVVDGPGASPPQVEFN